MRRKIREIMNKEEGFTLVELLAVLAILAIIVAIAIPAIGNVISESKAKAVTAETELIEDAARLYDIENPIENGETVKLSDLIDAGYLDLRDSKLDESSSVKKEKVEDGTGYTFVYVHPKAGE